MAVSITQEILAELFGPPKKRRFRVQLWDGTVEASPDADTPFTVILRRPDALRRMLLPPSELAIGEAYMRDDFDVLGNLEAATDLADSLRDRLRSPARLVRLARLLRSLPVGEDDGPRSVPLREPARLTGRRHSRFRDRIAVRSHYDVGNEFYALWLDPLMVYSCAYFQDAAQDLASAQIAKLDHICRKLRLQPGDRFLDIGCGWGALVRQAAARYGVEAVGITLSEPQATLARARIAADGLGDRCRIEVCDYREFAADARFNKIASVGMVEHVGRVNLPRYFAEAFRLLPPGGLFLNHGIVQRPAFPANPVDLMVNRLWKRQSFLDRHVFPDGELVPLGDIIGNAEIAGFEVRDVEPLREHYVLTLRHWVRRLESKHEEAARMVGEPTYRVWRLYMAGAARRFASGHLNVAQSLLSKPGSEGNSHEPLTRADLYTSGRGTTTFPSHDAAMK